MAKIHGVHHIALKPVPALYDKVVEFYCNTLGCTPVVSWGEGDHRACMVTCGDGTAIEVLCGEDDGTQKTGNFNHVAFRTEEVDELMEEVRAQGYRVTIEPNTIYITPDYPIRAGFFIGPLGEVIELFREL